MPFADAYFIKPDIVFNPDYRRKNPAPLFRKSFYTDKVYKKAKLCICGLGYAYCYINGKKISDDLFCAPVSNYNKTLWYVEYDVSSLLKVGENLISVICGNGWYNEEFRSSWNHNKADWRDLPKFILRLDLDGEMSVISDRTWKCLPHTAIVFNALRSGETFDARLYDKNMITLSYDDSCWQYAAADTSPPTGVFRKCLCEPIREHEVLSPCNIIQTAADRFVYDMGQNISGYIRLTAKGIPGQIITIRYSELLTGDNKRELNHMEKFYPESDIQTDRFICSGEELTWSPCFTYHGFRYIEIEGIHSADEVCVSAVFVHQAIKARTEFSCSDKNINALFRAGQISSYSNMFYLISDCPTREKMGWLNDVQMSCEQLCTNFHIEKLLKKWLTDIYDAMRDDGALPGIVPTPGWGYTWGNGPVADGALFEIPYRLWLHSGDATELKASVPYFSRYLSYLKKLENENGQISYGLDDWAPPHKESLVPAEFINDILRIRFYRIYMLSLTLSNQDTAQTVRQIDNLIARVKSDWVDKDGYCKINELTAISMLITQLPDLRKAPLKQQLKKRFEEQNFHHNCGIVGMRWLFDAFNECGLEEYALRLLTESGFPGYRHWLDAGATTLWEKWFLDNSEGSNSRNHHMYSHFMSWLIETVLGIHHNRTEAGTPEFTVSPFYFSGLTYAQGSYQTDTGKLKVDWNKADNCISLTVTVEGSTSALYGNRILSEGTYKFIISQDKNSD